MSAASQRAYPDGSPPVPGSPPGPPPDPGPPPFTHLPHLPHLAAGHVSFWVPGRPRTKGSMKPTHTKLGRGLCRIGMREDGEYSKPWKLTMIKAIRAQLVCHRWPWPVRVDCVFVFEREGGDQLPWPTGHGYGDVDKLERNLLDALTQSGLIFDDALVVNGTRAKRFVSAEDDGRGPGVWARVAPLTDADGRMLG